MANSQGCFVWRSNVVGIFDAAVALKKILDLVKSGTATLGNLKKALASSYRVTHDLKGSSDIIGYLPTGQFIAIEIKGKGDKLDKDGGYAQENFLREVGMKKGLAFVIAEQPEKIKLKVLGSEKHIVICSELDFLTYLKDKMR
jgi:hypothetical protein